MRKLLADTSISNNPKIIEELKKAMSLSKYCFWRKMSILICCRQRQKEEMISVQNNQTALPEAEK